MRQIGTNRGESLGAAIADTAGGVFIAGATDGSFASTPNGSVDAWIARYDSEGVRAWTRQIGSSAFESSPLLADGGSGVVYVAGDTEGALGGAAAGNKDVWLARYDGGGQQSWILQMGTSSYESIIGAASDGAGGALLSGPKFGAFGGRGAGGVDAWLGRFDDSGNQLWLRQFGSLGTDDLKESASDGLGGLFMVGSTDGSLFGPNAGSRDAWVTRYDGGGNALWSRQLGTSSFDSAQHVVTDGQGGAFVVGTTTGTLAVPPGGGYDVWIARFDPAGGQSWIRQLGSSSLEDVKIAIADGAGGVILAGITYSDLFAPAAGSADVWVTRYDPGGHSVWSSQFGSEQIDIPSTLVSDGAGGVYVGGATSDATPNVPTAALWVAHLDSTGSRTWSQRFGSSLFVGDSLTAAAPDGVGGVFVSGQTVGTMEVSSGSTDGWLARFGANHVGERFCTPATPSSEGSPGQISAIGNTHITANDLTLHASFLPRDTFGVFLTSRQIGSHPNPAQSQGTLCLTGTVGYFTGPGQVGLTGASGMVDLRVDLTQMPTPLGFVGVQPGERWAFQAWYRDLNPSAANNFTDAVYVRFD